MPSRTERLLQDPLLNAVRTAPEQVALYDEGRPHTYAQLLDAAQRLAHALRARGLQRGDRVVLYLDNRFECALSIYGVLLAGGVFVIVNPQTKRDKLAHILRDCAAVWLVSERRLARHFEPATVAQPALAGVLCLGQGDTPGAHVATEDLTAVLARSTPRPGPTESIPLDLASIIYTSGSTGQPKGVMMTHQSMLFTAGSLIEYLRLDASHRIASVVPLAFDYGLYQLLMAVGVGGTLILERGFTYPANVLERMRALEATVFPGVPTIFATLREMSARTDLVLPSVQRVTNTAAALPADFLPALERIFPRALIFAMYGLTECKRVAYLEPELLRAHPGSVGRAIPGTEVFLRTPDGGSVATGEQGILHVRGPHVMLGYLNLPEATARMLKPGPLPGERVLCTGDWFRQDEHGLLYFVGRSDDIIKSRGEKVSPVEVENCLHGLPGVREVAVVGVVDATLGEAVRAVIVAEDSAMLDAKAVQRFCQARLENHMVPRDVVFVTSLEKSPSGKIIKKGLDAP